MSPPIRTFATAALLAAALASSSSSSSSPAPCAAFLPPLPATDRVRAARAAPPRIAAVGGDGGVYDDDDAGREARELMERVRRMREEIAELEGTSVEEVQREATERRNAERERMERVEREREERELERAEASSAKRERGYDDGRFLEIPDTFDEQVRQASDAAVRAFRDGATRQIVRFALLPETETLMEKERNWPGGAEQMYREAAGPMTRAFLSEVRAPTTDEARSDPRAGYRPNITSEDVWDFDGSAVVTAEAATGPENDVRALVFPNTDNKYSKDIKRIDAEMGDRLFVLINPFWRNLDSWGFNILAPKAKELAQEAIFDRGFEETYVLLQKSVRGEECVALKAHPYDWQLYAYAEDESWPYNEFPVRLGSTKEEPTSADFAELLNEREEFKLSKNMRAIQRMRNR